MNHEDHIRGLGLLVSYFHTFEFALRAVLKNHEMKRMEKTDYSILKAGATVSEDPMTNYDSMGTLIEKYNKIAPKELRIKDGLVAVRDAIAHGRVFSDTPDLPMRLFKFDKPKKGLVSVTFAETLDQRWFSEMSQHIYQEIQKVMKVNEQYG
jgi:hypothetical protein